MNIFAELENFMFEKEAYHLDKTNPSIITYWKKKNVTNVRLSNQ